MGRISVLVPTEEMVHLSHNILQEGRFSDIQEVIQVSTEDAVAQARQAAARGSSILVARGLQAALIKRHTSIPVVEIVISAQEMALLIQRARQLILKERPTIAVAGNQNMFCDMSRFEDIFHINLQLFLAQDDEDLERKAQALQNQTRSQAQIIGQPVCALSSFPFSDLGSILPTAACAGKPRANFTAAIAKILPSTSASAQPLCSGK